ncbi:hypothetical protein F4820DRAFT_454503 [Hypoxylon rubiginosum]|uniref:Uncharacterized protein n=1 Tax=Hypoxylon rubiginosum TaxID=110542 RepID=A0ACB9YIF4_9PEZI|nr:hypothetical protein F4820DRAFT_454503 [Hypoxylon rubiginosum]
MDKTNSDNTTTTSSRIKAAKKRNSDVRKEQNRIASRAYREKRKQKLALLDEILKTDSQTDSMSSVSDETEGYTASWSLAQSRHASNSPVPAALSTVPVASQWPTTSPSMSSAVPVYSHDSYDNWMNCFDRPSNAFSSSNDYVQQFEVGGTSLDTAASYNMPPLPSMTSAPSTPPVPPMPLDPLLVASFAPHSHHSQPVHITSSSNLPTYSNESLQRQLWVDSLEDNAVVALERFGELSHVQQKQVLALIQERRRFPRSTSHDQNPEFIYPTCQATPPPSAQFISTDFRKYQNIRQTSGSPIPGRHH